MIGKVTLTAGAKYHLALTVTGRVSCGTLGGHLVAGTTPSRLLSADELCQRCFTEAKLTVAYASNAARGWAHGVSHTAARVITRLIGEAGRLIESPAARAAREATLTAIREHLGISAAYAA